MLSLKGFPLNTWTNDNFNALFGKNTFVVLFINRFATVSTGWNPSNSKIPAVPDPINRASADSFLFESGGDMY